MKIIRTIESFYPFVSGPANQAYIISSMLEKNKINSPILTTFYRAKESPIEEKMGNVIVKRFKSKFNLMKYFFTPDIKNEILKEDFDVIHAHNYRCYQTDIGARIAKSKNKPFVLSAHGSITGFATSLSGIQKLPYIIYDFLTKRRALKTADAIIVNSKQEYARAIKYGIPEEKLHLIPVGFNKKRVAPRKYEEKDLLRGLFVGNISRNRNLQPIIKALADCKQNIRIRIVGQEMQSSATLKSGYIEEMKLLAKVMGVDDRIDFVGAKYGKDLDTEYQNADFFIYTSISENFGQTIMEAGGFGLPLILTPVGIAQELIKDGENGYLVESNETEDIAIKMDSLASAELREKFGKDVQERVFKKYSWENIGMEYEKIYLKLIEKYKKQDDKKSSKN